LKPRTEARCGNPLAVVPPLETSGDAPKTRKAAGKTATIAKTA
jgi:hypothetical protein